MIDEQIIKVFEEVAGDNHIPITHQIICGDALGVLKRQKAEIERLKKENDKAGVKRLKKENDVLKTNYESMCISLPNIAKAERKEAIKEFADKINELLARYSHLHNNAEDARQDTIEAADGTDIEMQSVWDVFTLKNNEMAEYEEMNRLQKNIEIIAEERLLKEIEKDFRLLVREMTEAQE